MSKGLENSVAAFYKQQYGIFKYFALWELPASTSKRRQIAFTIYFWHIAHFWMVLFDVSMLIQVISNIASLNEIIKVFFIFATAIGVMAKFVTIKMNNHLYISLFKLMHTIDFLPVNPYEEKIFSKAIELSRQVRNIYAILAVTALNALLLTQYITDSSELPLSTYNPINVETTWRYSIVFFYQYVSLSICCLLNIAFDSLVPSLSIHLKCLLDILSYRLENIGRDSSDSQEIINLQLKDCIRFYSKILGLAERIEDLISIPVSVQIFCSVLVLTANFYALSFFSGPGDQANFFKFSVYQVCMLWQIFMLCYFPNEVSLQSTQLSYALYTSEWMVWNKANRKLMLLMMLRFDTPIRIRTINRCYSFNLPIFTSIVNSSYSYFALLKKINS